jgi:mono/diheme cytochrome c family protein
MSTAHDREKTEPTEEDKAIPLSMWVVAGILTAWGVGFYAVNAQQAITTTQTEPTLAANTQSGGAAEPTTKAPATSNDNMNANTTAGNSEVSKASSEILADGAAVYSANCQACHQANGTGLPGAFPPLKDSEWVVGDPHVLSGIILAGYTGQMEVLNQTYNGAMPSFARLSDDEVAAVANYLRTELNAAEPLDKTVITKTRASIPATPYSSTDDLDNLKALAQ